jgi:hypothetical protein
MSKRPYGFSLGVAMGPGFEWHVPIPRKTTDKIETSTTETISIRTGKGACVKRKRSHSVKFRGFFEGYT